ncbi:MAG TPA: hypothetical protein EYH41_14970 [Novosphingobium capsulatum]|nr:hypothetical protein [Novosphingobium capsulatum]
MDGMRDYVGQETRDRDAFEAAYGASPGFDGDDTPPPVLETDERRMQVRAYNFWASMLGTTPFPLVKPLLDGHWPAFADHSVLLHFDAGLDDPAIAYVGEHLLHDCEAPHTILRLNQVPGRSILSRITDHYLQIVANEAPIGFEAEFTNQRDRTILYRGILLPFSSDGTRLDYIYGVINWKELADQATTDGIMAEIGQLLSAKKPRRKEPRIDPVEAGHLSGPLSSHVPPAMPNPVFAANSSLPHSGLPHSGLPHWADGPARGRDAPTLDLDPGLAIPELDLADLDIEILPALETFDDTSFGNTGFGNTGLTEGLAEPEPDSLADWLACAREMAELALGSEDRTRQALYAAIGRAWDFALAAEAEPEDFAEMLADAGLTMQARAPLIPVVKLVFGASYDKTRLTEYATALAHAHRIGLSRGELGQFLGQTPGGLKGVVAAERRLRRAEEGTARTDPRAALEAGLRTLPIRSLDDLPETGREFTLVMVRRLPEGGLAVLGEVLDDETLLERAARRLIP